MSLILTGCETLNGVSSAPKGSFPRLQDKSCIENAIKAVPAVEYLKSKEDESSARSVWGKPILTKTYHAYYKIKGLSVAKTGDPSVFIEETVTEDVTPHDNRVIYYGNSYMNMNGPAFSKVELSQARDAIQAVNDAVWKTCKLTVPQPRLENL